MPSALARRRKNYETEVEIRQHRLIVDEPEDNGGNDAGPRPSEMLAASLASCTAITVLMYAGRKGWELGDLEVAVDHTAPSVHDSPSFTVEIRTPAELSDEQRERILVIAGKCPVHRTLKASDVKIEDSLELIDG